MKKLVLLLVSLGLLLSPLSTLALQQPGTGSTASTSNYEWLNAYTLTDGTNIYVDTRNNNGNYGVFPATDKFYRNNGDSCATQSYITNITPTAADLYKVSSIATSSNCNNAAVKSIHIDQASDANQAAYFYFNDSSTINIGNDRRAFNYTSNNTYVESNSDAADNNGQKCFSSITINSDSLNSDGTVKETSPNAVLTYEVDTAANINADSYSQSMGAQIGALNNGAGGINGTPDGSGCYSKKFNIYVTDVANGPSKANPPNAQAAAATQTDPCSVQSASFAWLICPAIKLGNTITNFAFNKIVGPLLAITPLSAQPDIETIWASVRNIADLFFVIIFMVVIFGSAFGADAYTIKKVLPRLVISAIAIQLSFFFCSFLVDVGNILGAGVGQLIHTAVPSNVRGSDPSAWASGLGTTLSLALGVAAIAAIGLPTVALALLSLLIGLIGLTVTLILRQLLVVVLVIASPLAFVAWVLPNTENLFRSWTKNMIRLILMYPMIVGIIGIAEAMTPINLAAQYSGGDASGLAVPAGNIKNALIGFLPIIALFAIPATFKMSGGLMGAVNTQISKRTSGLQKGVTQGQLAKDVAARHKDNALLKYGQAKTPFGKAIRRVQAGPANMIPTAASKRRMLAGAATVTKQRAEELGASFAAAGYERDALAAIAGAAIGSEITVKGKDRNGNPMDTKVKVTAAHQQKAIETLAKTAGYDQLRLVKASVGKPGGVAAATWQAGIAGSEAAILGAAPDVIAGTAAFDNLTANQVAGFKGGTADTMMKYMNGLKTNLVNGAYDQDPAKKASVVATLGRAEAAVRGISATPPLRGQVDPQNTGSTIRDQATSVAVSEDPANPGHYIDDPAKAQSLESLIDALGNFIALPAAGGASGAQGTPTTSSNPTPLVVSTSSSGSTNVVINPVSGPTPGTVFQPGAGTGTNPPNPPAAPGTPSPGGPTPPPTTPPVGP